MRMRGHAEHDDMKYVPPEMVESWARRDPLLRYEAHLLGRDLASRAELDRVEAEVQAFVASELAAAETSPLPDPGSGLDGVYADGAAPPPVPPLVREWEAGREGRWPR
jgi:TPP-dependent pyruvate/acetoin dehydrogenase alpha subunit